MGLHIPITQQLLYKASVQTSYLTLNYCNTSYSYHATIIIESISTNVAPGRLQFHFRPNLRRATVSALIRVKWRELMLCGRCLCFWNYIGVWKVQGSHWCVKGAGFKEHDIWTWNVLFLCVLIGWYSAVKQKLVMHPWNESVLNIYIKLLTFQKNWKQNGYVKKISDLKSFLKTRTKWNSWYLLIAGL